MRSSASVSASLCSLDLNIRFIKSKHDAKKQRCWMWNTGKLCENGKVLFRGVKISSLRSGATYCVVVT